MSVVPWVVLRTLLSYVQKHSLLRPGDRLGVAVSGGADSVALLRAFLELRGELGIVLAAVHVNHQLRGEEAEHDENFVRQLSADHQLEIHVSQADTRLFAREKELSIEAAARELRYSYFGRLIQDVVLDKIATAHTLDDQAETVLLRVIRGTGTSGLSGIHPRLVVGEKGADWKGIIRPLLTSHRSDVERYLTELRQIWCTDSTNAEMTFTRNRIRHQLLPTIGREFNPEITGTLANLAEIARAEDEFWSSQTAEAFIRVQRNRCLAVDELQKFPLALQRRVLRLAAVQAGTNLDFHHSERILDQIGKAGFIELPNGFRAVVDHKTVSFETTHLQAKPCGYSYQLAVPGVVEVAELGIRIRAFVSEASESSRYNDEPELGLERLPAELIVRNWRPGDRFWPAHARSPKKVKELLQERHLPAREKALWPVALAGDDIVWVRGFPPSSAYVAKHGKGVVIQTEPLISERK